MSHSPSPESPDAGRRPTAPPLGHDAETDVLVIGAGLAGLTAAVCAARSGAKVVLLDARNEIGGRARSERIDGFSVNEGAHALYRAGEARSVLRDLGIRPRGRIPRQRRGAWLVGEEAVPWRRTSAVGGIGSAARALRALASKRAAQDAEGQSMADWILEQVPDEAREFAEMLVRTTAYCADMESLDAAAALAQVRLGGRGVLYLHGGWQALVDSLRVAALDAGVDLRSGRVTKVTSGGERAQAALSNGVVVDAGAAVLAAGGPSQAASMLDGASAALVRWSTQAAPVRAACLDLLVSEQAPGGRRTTFGLGQPLYLVDHAATARVAPSGGGLFHGLWYEPDLVPDVDVLARLEASMDAIQPGWRARLVSARRRQQMVVAHDRPQPNVPESQRPTVAVPNLSSVFVAGDWVAGHGMLADAAMGSGRDAGFAAAEASMAAPPSWHRSIAHAEATT